MHNSIRLDVQGSKAKARAELKARVDAINADAREFWHDPTWRHAMAVEITETTFEGFQHENLLELFTTVETVGDADEITVEEIRGLEVFWVSLGGQIDQSSIEAFVGRLPRDYVGFHVSELEEKMEANFAIQGDRLVDLAIEQMDASVNARMFGMFQTAIGVGSDFYIGTNGLALPAVDTALTEVRDESRDDQVAIIGRATMVDQFMNQLVANNNFAPETNEAIIQMGVLGRYRGARLIRLTNWKNRWGRSFFPANELFILGRDASKAGFFGAMRAQEWSEQGGWYWHYMGRRAFGAVVHRPDRIRRVVDTSMAA